MPLFSVVIPVYNKQNDIGKTLQSVFDQSFTDFEVIVVNDGSTDDSETNIIIFTDERLKYYKTENHGVSQARNFAIGRSSGRIIAFLDADDYWYPNHLEKLAKLADKYPPAGIIATSYEFAHPHGKETPYFDGLEKGFTGIMDDIFIYSMRYRLLWTSALAIRKEVFDKVGLFDPEITLGAGEDTDMWIRASLSYPVAFNNTVTAVYNTGASNRVSHSDTLKRSFAKLQKFNEREQTMLSLKKFLDIYRCEYALKHKLAGDNETASFYLNQADKKNIPFKIKILMSMPIDVLYVLYKLKQKLKRLNFNFSVYN